MQRILVIDDDDLSRELLTMLLEADGYAVESAASGDEALAQPAATDLILTDMQMPGLCGNALAERLRSQYGQSVRGVRGIRIIAMSGSEVSPADRAQFDGFLLKPFSVTDLEALLAEPPTKSGAPHLASEMWVPTEATPSTILDEATYTKLHIAMSPHQVTEMFAFCLADADKRLARMTEALTTGDDATYRSEAHTIKGGCGMLGALELKQIAGAMEDGGIAADQGNGGSELGTLRDQFAGAVTRLQRILEAHPRDPGAA